MNTGLFRELADVTIPTMVVFGVIYVVAHSIDSMLSLKHLNGTGSGKGIVAITSSIHPEYDDDVE